MHMDDGAHSCLTLVYIRADTHTVVLVDSVDESALIAVFLHDAKHIAKNVERVILFNDLAQTSVCVIASSSHQVSSKRSVCPKAR